VTKEPQLPLSLSALEFVTPICTDVRSVIEVRTGKPTERSGAGSRQTTLLAKYCIRRNGVGP